MAALPVPKPNAAPEAARTDVAAFVRDAETLALLEDYLDDASLGKPVIGAGGVEAAVKFLERAPQPPRVLIVDLSGLDTPLSAVDQLADVCEPSITVIAIGERDNTHLFRELIRAGIADYITKPVAPELLEPYIRRGKNQITTDGMSARRGKIVAIAGARGGVGATTLSVAAAWTLANRMKRRVALVDLDMHGGAACLQLGLEPGGLRDALLNHRRIDGMFLERTLVKHGERLAVLAEEMPLDADAAIDPAALDAVLAALAADYHYVIVDLPCAFGALHAHMFRTARARAVVVDRTLPALRDGARLLDMAREQRETALLVVNDHHPGLTRAVDAQTIAKALGRDPDLEIPYDRGAAQRSDNLAEPVAASGAMAKAADDLVAALSGRPLRKPSRWARLFGAKRA